MAELSPQRQAFKEYYTNPNSETFNQIEESALKAGFAPQYAKCLMSESQGNEWVKQILKNSKLKIKAERNLEKFLDDDSNPSIQADITKFTLKTLGRDEYSERTELTGSNGKDLIPNEETKKKANEAINSFLNDKDK